MNKLDTIKKALEIQNKLLDSKTDKNYMAREAYRLIEELLNYIIGDK